MRRTLLIAAGVLVLLVLGVGSAVALNPGEHVACTPTHTIADNGTNLEVVGGDCVTATDQTVTVTGPTTTVTQTVTTGGTTTTTATPPPPPAISCPGASEWSACFNGDWHNWTAFNGNPNQVISNWTFQNAYFSFTPSPAVEGSSFKAYVDSGAAVQEGQRSLVYIFPYHNVFGDGETKAQQGQDQWYRDELYFPADYQPVANTSWNWVWEIHNWPENACCAHLSLGVITNAEDGGTAGGERLSLRILGGGDATHPADNVNAAASPTPTGFRRTWAKGPSIQRGHWYDLLVHVKWDYTSAGHVDWFLDGQQLVNYSGPTLYWYADSDTGKSGNQPGPGLGYLMEGNYRDSSTNPPPSSVYHDDSMRGPTRASVGG